jgi:hypothetical protein
MNIFIAGPRAISKLKEEVIQRINNMINEDYTILLGDANGIDKAVQHYLYERNYNNVRIYATKGKARNNKGSWYVHSVDVSNNLKGFDFYAAKDYEMAKDADYGLMIWNGKSKGTLNNTINLLSMDKKTIIYFTPENQLYAIKSLSGLREFITRCDNDTQQLYLTLLQKNAQLQLNI